MPARQATRMMDHTEKAVLQGSRTVEIRKIELSLYWDEMVLLPGLLCSRVKAESANLYYEDLWAKADELGTGAGGF